MEVSDKPMMARSEIEIIDNLIEQYKPSICLELGSGGSTIYFPEKHSCIKTWYSIEHNGHYAKAIENRIDKKVKLTWIRDDKEDSYFKEAERYTYDFILIDGLNRERAIKMLPKILNKDGFALLHDSGRIDLRPLVNKYNGRMLIKGELPYNGYYRHRGLAIFKND